jgi:uncharacterized pyridoxamine 5'-phosphate oxidase family protein
MKKVIEFLKANTSGHCAIATCSDNKPRVSAMEYTMLGDDIVFSTSPDSIKAQNIAKNNQVSFSFHNMPKFVTIDGTTTSITESETEQAMKMTLEENPQLKPMIESGQLVLKFYKIVPKTVYFIDYSQGMAPTEIINL